MTYAIALAANYGYVNAAETTLKSIFIIRRMRKFTWLIWIFRKNGLLTLTRS